MQPTEAICWEKEGDVTVVRFTENHIADEAYTARARKELRDLAKSVGGKVLVSLANVEFMASIGITLLVELDRLRRTSHIQLKVCEAQPLVRQVFLSAHLNRILGIYATRADALAAFAAGQ
ncbi:MAG: STAS domain-containing protein [Planctomycetes bacterium]|nr:STAS domain-containing protein [Planctomycetota bacterium]